MYLTFYDTVSSSCTRALAWCRYQKSCLSSKSKATGQKSDLSSSGARTLAQSAVAASAGLVTVDDHRPVITSASSAATAHHTISSSSHHQPVPTGFAIQPSVTSRSLPPSAHSYCSSTADPSTVRGTLAFPLWPSNSRQLPEFQFPETMRRQCHATMCSASSMQPSSSTGRL